MREQKMDTASFNHLWLLWLLPLGSLAGCAALLRSGQPLNWRSFATAVLNSGLFAVAIAYYMLWHFGPEELPLIVSVSIFAGLGGNTVVDFLLVAVMKWVEKKQDE